MRRGFVAVAGSGQLNDYWGGPWAFPFTLLEWSLLARASGAKMAFLSLGAGPLRTPLGKIFIKQALRRADYRSYRDEDSRRCIAALGIPGEHLVVPDLVFSLDLDGAAPVDRVSGQRVVGINPMPFFDAAYYPESDPGVFGNYLRVLASFADGLIERGYLVRFFATQLRVDHGVIDRVRALMAHGAAAVPITSLEELIAAIDSLDIVVSTGRCPPCVHSSSDSTIRLSLSWRLTHEPSPRHRRDGLHRHVLPSAVARPRV